MDEQMSEIAALKQIVSDLSARVKTLELRPPSPTYKGTYVANARYQKGDMITFMGGLWLALDATQMRPPSNGWKLVVKSGSTQ